VEDRPQRRHSVEGLRGELGGAPAGDEDLDVAEAFVGRIDDSERAAGEDVEQFVEAVEVGLREEVGDESVAERERGPWPPSWLMVRRCRVHVHSLSASSMGQYPQIGKPHSQRM
jgi:hypothetical protein